MPFLVASSMLLAFALFSALFQGAGKRFDNKNRRIRAISGKPPAVDEELETPFAERFFMPILRGMLRTLSRIIPKEKDSALIETKIRQAGIAAPVGEYVAAKLMAVFGIMGLAFILAFSMRASSAVRFFVLLIGCILAVGGPNYYLAVRIRKRTGAIRNQLPDIMDLLTVCVEAGLGFDAALLKISEHFKGPLVDEFTIVHREIQMGLPRKEALKKFADRNGIPELKTFVGALIQADQMGIPIKNVLRTQSSQLRLARKQAAEEKAMKAPVKMMFPLIAFILPVIFIILLGPTILRIVKVF